MLLVVLFIVNYIHIIVIITTSYDNNTTVITIMLAITIHN